VLRKSSRTDVVIVIYYINSSAACLEIVVIRIDLGSKEQAERDTLRQGVEEIYSLRIRLVSEWLDGAESFLIYWLSVNWLRRDLVSWKPSFITVFEINLSLDYIMSQLNSLHTQSALSKSIF